MIGFHLRVEAGEVDEPFDAGAPYRNLWASVMAQALNDLRDHSPAIQGWARAWLYDDSANARSFVWICNLLGLNPEAVRERVEAGKVMPVGGRPGRVTPARSKHRSRDLKDLTEWFRDWEQKNQKVAA